MEKKTRRNGSDQSVTRPPTTLAAVLVERPTIVLLVILNCRLHRIHFSIMSVGDRMVTPSRRIYFQQRSATLLQNLMVLHVNTFILLSKP
jgi:hypothetical protein